MTNTTTETFQIIAPGLTDAFPEGIARTAAEIAADSYEVACRFGGVNTQLATEVTIAMTRNMAHAAIDKTEAYIGRPLTHDEAAQAWTLISETVVVP